MADDIINISSPFIVIPAKAGIQSFLIVLDSRFHGSDGVIDLTLFK